MIRKLIRQGSTSLVVSMPIGWVRSLHLHVGDEIDVHHQGNTVIVKPKEDMVLSRFNLNVESLDEMALYINLLNLYRKGFDEIKILSHSNKVMDYETKRTVSTIRSIKKWLPRFLGWEIITQDPIIIKDITGESSENPETLIHRVFFLLTSFVDEEIASIKGKGALPDPHEFYMATFKLINYSIRMYNKRPQKSFDIILLQHLHAIAQQLRDLQPYIQSNQKAILPMLSLLRPALRLYGGSEISAFIKTHHEMGLELDRLRVNNDLFRMLLRLHSLYMDVIYTVNFLQFEKGSQAGAPQ